MKTPASRSGTKNNASSLEDQSQDAARLAETKPRAPWETRQPAQVTKSDVERAQSNPAQVTPPGKMGESQGAAS